MYFIESGVTVQSLNNFLKYRTEDDREVLIDENITEKAHERAPKGLHLNYLVGFPVLSG